jgi:predicted alpha/beta hydrolase family esterase
MKKQIVVIHGGHPFDKYEDFLDYMKKRPVVASDFKLKTSWREALVGELGNNFELFHPVMPNKNNAHYEEWKIWFEKMFPFLDDNATYIGHSLGGIFLAKYLSENTFPKRIKAVIMVAAPYEGKNQKHIRNNNYILGDLNDFIKQANKIFIFHSKDDKVVPISDFEIYKKLLPQAEFHLSENEGHFNGMKVEGLVDVIKKLYK